MNAPRGGSILKYLLLNHVKLPCGSDGGVVDHSLSWFERISFLFFC